jgi:hypothetical protein
VLLAVGGDATSQGFANARQQREFGPVGFIQADLEVQVQGWRPIEFNAVLTTGCLPATVEQDGEETTSDKGRHGGLIRRSQEGASARRTRFRRIAVHGSIPLARVRIHVTLRWSSALRQGIRWAVRTRVPGAAGLCRYLATRTRRRRTSGAGGRQFLKWVFAAHRALGARDG